MAYRSNIMAANYSFSVVLEPQEGGGYSVLVPALPEVVTEVIPRSNPSSSFLSTGPMVLPFHLMCFPRSAW